MSLGSGAESTLAADIAFWAIAASVVVASIAVVHVRDVFRAALFLVVVFLGAAGLFVLLRAEFLAVVQVIIYVGAISVLILFAVLMTQDAEQGSPPNRLRYPVGILAFLIGGAATLAILSVRWVTLADLAGGGALTQETAGMINDVYANAIPKLASLLLRDYVLAFEAVSLLLLAVIVGAIALVRER